MATEGVSMPDEDQAKRASRWRQALARQIAPVYVANPKVAAVLVGGSSARGHADRYSDIEIGVFWHEPPTDTDRRAAVEQTGGDWIRLYPFDADEQVWSDDYTIGRAAPDQPQSGILIETCHYTTRFMDTVLRDVLERHDPADLKQNLISGVLTGMPLHGIDRVERWQAAARYYSDGLAVAMVNAHAQFDHYWRVEMLIERRNLPILYGMFSQVEQKLLRVLLGVNRVYYFGFKWLDVVAACLLIAPSDLVARLNRVFQLTPAEGGRRLAALVEETYDLVEQRLPAVDVARLRKIFRHRRAEWAQPPLDLAGGAAAD